MPKYEVNVDKITTEHHTIVVEADSEDAAGDEVDRLIAEHDTTLDDLLTDRTQFDMDDDLELISVCPIDSSASKVRRADLTVEPDPDSEYFEHTHDCPGDSCSFASCDCDCHVHGG